MDKIGIIHELLRLIPQLWKLARKLNLVSGTLHAKPNCTFLVEVNCIEEAFKDFLPRTHSYITFSENKFYSYLIYDSRRGRSSQPNLQNRSVCSGQWMVCEVG